MMHRTIGLRTTSIAGLVEHVDINQKIVNGKLLVIWMMLPLVASWEVPKQCVANGLSQVCVNSLIN